MDLYSFVGLVGGMRRAQKRYFSGRNPKHLNEARDYERRVDEAIKNYLDTQTAQLFDAGPSPTVPGA